MTGKTINNKKITRITIIIIKTIIWIEIINKTMVWITIISKLTTRIILTNKTIIVIRI